MIQNVVHIRPKTVTQQYRRMTITITYDTLTRTWVWSFDHVVHLPFSGAAETLDKAIKAAQKQVDFVLGPE